MAKHSRRRSLRLALLIATLRGATALLSAPPSPWRTFHGRTVVLAAPRGFAPVAGPSLPRSSSRPRLPHGTDPQSSSTAVHLSLTRAASLAADAQRALHGDPAYGATALLALAGLGLSLERRSSVGKALSAPLATMALALAAANLGLLPFQCAAYTAVNAHLVPLAVPLLLMDAHQIQRLFRPRARGAAADVNDEEAPNLGALLAAFAIGAFATLMATLMVFPLVPLRSLGAVPGAVATYPPSTVGWRVAVALAARHIGGAVNFVAVAETLHIPGAAVAAALAADNVVVALYFAALFALAPQGTPAPNGLAATAAAATVVSSSELEFSVSASDQSGDTPPEAKITLPTLSLALTTASALVTVGGFLTRALLPKGTSSLPLTSILTAVAATAFPKFFNEIRAAGNALGILFIQLFFAASGAAGSIALVLRQAPSLFAFSALQVAGHFGILLGMGRGMLGLPLRELCLASNACVGGPTTAAAMAQAKDWRELVLPALWVGILGYTVATALALALGPLLWPLLR